MQLQEPIYLLHLGLKSCMTFEQFIAISSLIVSKNYSLKDTVSEQFLLEFMERQESLVILEALNLVENSILFLLALLFNQLQHQYYLKTRSDAHPGTTGTLGTIGKISQIQEKYLKTLEFWKSQIREFICCVSTIQNPEYLNVGDTNLLRVSKDLVLDILNLLLKDVQFIHKMDLGFSEIEGIMDSISNLPINDESNQIIQGKSQNALVLKELKSVIISSCLDCTIYILGNVESVYISNISNCQIYISCCTILNVDYGYSCCIKGVCNQVFITNSSNCTNSLYTISKPVILNCSELTFSPIDFCWDGHGLDLENSGLNYSKNYWDSWISLNSSKLEILDPNEFNMESLPFSREKSSTFCCLEIPMEYKLIISRNESILQEFREFINVNSRVYPDFFQEIQDSVSSWLKSCPQTKDYIKFSQEMP